MFVLEVKLEDRTKCHSCPMLSFNKPRTSSEIRKAYCGVRRAIIKSYIEKKAEVRRPSWCPLKEVSDATIQN